MRRSKSDWRRPTEEQRQSGLSATQFCREHSINANDYSILALANNSLSLSDNVVASMKAPLSPDATSLSDRPFG